MLLLPKIIYLHSTLQMYDTMLKTKTPQYSSLPGVGVHAVRGRLEHWPGQCSFYHLTDHVCD